MATLRKRQDKWQAQVRRRGAPNATRSFLLRSDAVAWARQMELQADRRGLATAHKALDQILVADIVMRYRDEVSPRKRSGDSERYLLNAFLRHRLAQVVVGDLTTGLVSTYCDERLRAVKAVSVRRELDILRHAFEVARRDWDLPLTHNAFALVRRPKGGDPRSRRLGEGERRRLEIACAQCRNPHMAALVKLALETAMRRGELLSARWCHVSLEARTLHIPHTKNGHARTVPLSGAAMEILRELDARIPLDDAKIVSITEDSAKMAWRRIVKRAGLIDLRFHDLRHEGRRDHGRSCRHQPSAVGVD
jgi:integrase